MKTRYVQQGEVWVPEHRYAMAGLGDAVGWVAKKLGFKETPGCGCSRRREKLNDWVPFGSGVRRRGDMPLIQGAGGGATPGASFRNCLTTEPAIHNDPHTLLCDDFETNGFGAAPGTWYTRGCDQVGTGGSGEAAAETKGWCGQPASVPGNIGPFTTCGGAGANGTACTARVTVNGDAEAHAQHNFQSTCQTGGLNCSVINGVAHYEEIYVRMMIRLNTGWQPGQNQKFITINPCCNGTGGIILGGTGMIFGDTKLSMVGIEDNWFYDNAAFYRNPNANGQGDNCSGSACEFVGDNLGAPLDLGGSRLGRWTAIEMRYRLNTSNVQNGIYQIWKDDCGVNGTTCPTTPTLRGSYTDIRYRGTNNGAGPGGSSNSTLKIGGLFVDTWTGGGPGQGSFGTMQIDQLVVSTQRIGWMGASTPPSNIILPGAAGAYSLTGSVMTPTRLAGPTQLGFVRRV